MKPATILSPSRLQARLLQSVRLLICLTCLSLAQPLTAVAQTNAPAPLPPAAQEAVNKGVIAAKVPDYLLAIRYFEEARKLAPEAPVIYLNMGLAESRIPGRELRAIAWFGAYLAAYPDAPNAAAVKEQIAVLDVTNLSNVSRLIQTLQDSSIKNNNTGMGDVAKLWANSGDIATALKTAGLAGEIYGGSAQIHIAAVQARAGDLAGALKTAGIVVRPDYRHDAFLGIAAIQIERGDLNGAESTIAFARSAADQISDGQTKSGKLNDIAKLQIKAGKMDGAQATLRAALTAVDLIVIPDEPERKDTYLSVRAQGQEFIADTQIAAGDIAGAKQSLALAFKNSELISDPDDRSQHQGFRIFDYYVKVGDLSNAIKVLKAYQVSVERITDADRKAIFTGVYDHKHKTLAEGQLKAGDIKGALKTVNEIRDVDYRLSILVGIIDAQVRAGDFQAAIKTNGEIADDEKRDYNLWDPISKAQVEAGDYNGALKTVKKITKADYQSWGVRNIVDAQVKAGDYQAAIKTNAETTDADARDLTLSYFIVKPQAVAGDFEGATKNADLIQVDKYKEAAIKAITEAREKANNPVVPATESTLISTAAIPSPEPTITAADWVKILDNTSEYGVALNTEPFLNLASYLNSMPSADNPYDLFVALYKTAEKLVAAQNVITGMLKQEIGK